MLESPSPLLISFDWAIGLFYVVGGFLHMRLLVIDAMVDDLLSMMGDKDAAAERLRTSVMTAGAALTFASGLSLLALSRWTPAVFACNLLLQGAYLLWARRAWLPQDPREAEGRRSTVRAFLIYIAAFVLVLYLGWMGVWRAWLEPAIAELAIIVALTGGLGWFLLRRPRPARDISVADSPTMLAPAKTWPRPAHLRLSPSYHCSPLWDHERGSAEDPADLGLSESLVERIRAWDAAFQATYSEDDPLGSIFASVEEERAWTREGDAIAAELEREWPGALTIEISALDTLVADSRIDLQPWDKVPAEIVQWIGERCGIAEIEAAIARLDKLSRDRDALPKWDGDTQDDIAEAQASLQQILARVPSRYVEDVAAGLDSPEDHTRAYAALALAGHDRDAALPLLRSALAREEAELVRVILAAAIAQAESTAIPHGQDERKDG